MVFSHEYAQQTRKDLRAYTSSRDKPCYPSQSKLTRHGDEHCLVSLYKQASLQLEKDHLSSHGTREKYKCKDCHSWNCLSAFCVYKGQVELNAGRAWAVNVDECVRIMDDKQVWLVENAYVNWMLFLCRALVCIPGSLESVVVEVTPLMPLLRGWTCR